jgi:hypothetical protein
MPSSRRVRVTDRSRRRDRHGRGVRSSVAGPHLPFLRTRVELFDDLVAETADHLRELWPDELADVAFEVAGLPAAPDASEVERWRVDRTARTVVLYRLPIERLSHVPEARRSADAEWQHRVLVEGWVLQAVGDLLGKDPWDLSPDLWRDR